MYKSNESINDKRKNEGCLLINEYTCFLTIKGFIEVKLREVRFLNSCDDIEDAIHQYEPFNEWTPISELGDKKTETIDLVNSEADIEFKILGKTPLHEGFKIEIVYFNSFLQLKFLFKHL